MQPLRTLSSRPSAWLSGFFLASALAAILSGCQTEEPPPPENFLRLQLNDSLARYDRVTVLIVDRVDTARLLDTLWDDPLPAPSKDIPDYNMKRLGTSEFIIKVTAWRANRVAVQTRIFYSPESQVVRHDEVPPLIPQNWLTSLKPDTGIMTPAFDRDSLDYLVKVPYGVNSVTFVPTISPEQAAAKVTIQARGQYVSSGSWTKAFQVGDSSETVTFSVTDMVTGAATTRNYNVRLFPTPPVGLYLDSLYPSSGFWNILYTPDNPAYNLYLFGSQDTVSFTVKPVDPLILVTVDGVRIFEGQRAKFTVPLNTTHIAGIKLRRGEETGFYQVTIEHRESGGH